MAQHTPVERMVAPGAAKSLGDVVVRHGLGQKLLLVCDDATWKAAGEIVQTALGGAALTVHSLGQQPHATLAHAQAVAEKASGMSGLIALGSGTVNDITKHAAAARNLPYVCVATAASMNGYSAANASPIVDGLKRSVAARPPRAVVADIDIIAAAPRRLARAGLGDTLCRSSVEADMLLSHLLLGTDYPAAFFDVLRTHEAELIRRAPDVRESDPTLLTLLMHALLDAGDAMTAYGSSAVASQGEHMIAHTIEMLYGAELYDITHGEIIAVTTITMNHLQQKMLLGTPRVATLNRGTRQFSLLFGKSSGADMATSYKQKLLSAEQVANINERIARDWPAMKAQLQRVMHEDKALERAFIHANIPYLPEALGILPERYETAVTYAYLTRERFTFLDLAAMNGKRAC